MDEQGAPIPFTRTPREFRSTFYGKGIDNVIERPDGSGEFTRVTLRPRMTITDAARIDDAVAIHHNVHTVCAIARSVNFPVDHEPQVTAV